MAEFTVDMKRYYDQGMAAFGRVYEIDPDYLKAVMRLGVQALKPGALSVKVKELISVAIGVVIGCPPCIAAHVKSAIGEGATKKEIFEAGEVAGLMGGGVALAHLRHLIDACDQFGAK